eukprot:1527779-Rhodomonas_salina.1
MPGADIPFDPILTAFTTQEEEGDGKKQLDLCQPQTGKLLVTLKIIITAQKPQTEKVSDEK